jgi:predicted AlkP superfamily phosphohydrolase/phosphomutase
MISSKRKVLVIGLDGATWDLIDPWMKAGLLPTFKQLIDGGTRGHLRSTLPAKTHPAWTTAFTGVNPGKHNIFGFMTSDGYSPKLISASNRKATPLWKIVSLHDLKVGVINIPISYPPDKVNGIMVSGIAGSPGGLRGSTYPPDIQELLKKIDYKIEVKAPRERVLNEILDMIEKRKTLATEVDRLIEWDLFIIVFVALDRVQHIFWNSAEVEHTDNESKKRDLSDSIVLRTYVKIDSTIKYLVDTIGRDANIFIFSDHGFGRQSKIVNLNRWLASSGTLKFSNNGRWNLIYKQALKRFLRNTLKFSSKVITSKRIEKAVNSRGLRNRTDIFSISEGLNWQRTKAWALPDGFIKINLKGREPLGTIEENDYSNFRKKLSSEILNLKDPVTKKNVIDKVYNREDIYQGPYTINIPDILVKPVEDYTLNSGFGDSLFEKHFRVEGCHRDFGMFIANGPDINENIEIEGSSLLDISPTILHMLGIKIPRYMDGKVIKDIFKEDNRLSKKSIQYEDLNKEKVRLNSKIFQMKTKRTIQRKKQ